MVCFQQLHVSDVAAVHQPVKLTVFYAQPCPMIMKQLKVGISYMDVV